MKTNLTAPNVSGARTALILLGFVCLGLLLNGCAASSPPSAVERVIFNVETNTVPVVTNWVSVVTVTNDLGTVETRNLVTWATNIETHVTYTVTTNAAALVQTTSRVTNLFAPGFGELLAALLAGILGTWAKLRSTINRGKAGTVALAQGIETLLAIVETTPQGQEIAARMKLELAKGQRTAGVLAEIAFIVENFVDNDQAKRAARLLLDAIPKT